MRLVKVVVESFQGIDHAEVELAEGLNILYGPNDLGKSTLARAIRAALLLPVTSKAAEEYLPWQRDAAPKVTLTFRHNDGRYYRVTKAFDPTHAASALLEVSRDGARFETEAKGRAVDEALRGLLEWGVPAPGGRSAGSRGMPQAFLGTTLLAEQTDVDAVLRQSLAGDPDGGEEVRRRLTRALEAFAVDPRFKRILDAAQREVDQHFTPKGQRTRKQDSALVKAHEQVSALGRELEAADAQAARVAQVEARVRELAAAVARAEGEAEAARARAAEVARAWTDGARRAEAEAALADRRGEVARIDALDRRAAQLAEEAQRLGSRLAEAEAVATAATARHEAAQSAVEAAKDALRREQSDAAEAARELERARLERARDALAPREDALEQRSALLEEARSLEKRLAALRTAAAAPAKERDKQAKAAAAAQKQLEETEALRGQLRALAAYARWHHTQRDREAVDKARAERGQVESRASEARREAEALRAAADARALPSLEEARAIDVLERDRQLAEAQLGGGLALAMTLYQAVEAKLRVDGRERKKPAASTRLEAKRKIALEIPGLLELEIVAGEAGVRNQLESLELDWQKKARPWLDRAGAADARSLLAEVEARAASLARAAQLEAEAQRLTVRLAELDALAGRGAGDAERATLLEQAAEAALVGRDRAKIHALAVGLGVAWEAQIDRQEATLAEAVAAATNAEKAARAALAKAEGELTRLGAETAQVEAELARKQAAVGADLAAAARALAADRSALSEARAELDAALKKLEAGGRSTLAQAEAALREAEARLTASAREVTAAREAAEALRSERDRRTGEADSARAIAASAPRREAADAVARAEATLAALARPEPAITEADVARAEAASRDAQRALEEARAEWLRAEGELRHAGGASVAERKDELRQAHADAIARQAAIELEGDAWKMLRDALTESESAGAKHLGVVLAEKIAPQLEALTHERYRGVTLAPQLGEVRVETAGGAHAPDVLSVGTREQLATLIRLAIAEALEHVIVLDDHLVQTDEARLDWFVEALAHAATKVQVVIITCRKRDYEAAERAEGARVSWIDLEARIRRIGQPDGARARAPRSSAIGGAGVLASERASMAAPATVAAPAAPAGNAARARAAEVAIPRPPDTADATTAATAPAVPAAATAPAAPTAPEAATAPTAAPRAPVAPPPATLPEALTQALAEMGASPHDLAARIGAGERVVRLWLSGGARPVGAIKDKLVDLMRGTPESPARTAVVRFLVGG